MSDTEHPTAATRRPTIRDVARKAAVSKSLVSLVYSDPQAVSPARRQRVLAAAEELGYRPNSVARSLNGTRDDLVGILVADPRNPVLDAVVEAAQEEFERVGLLGLMTGAVRPRADPHGLDLRVVAMVADLRPARILIVGSVPDMGDIARLVTGARIVVASAYPDGIDASSVRGDDDRGIRLVVDHLRGLGHRRIAYVGGGDVPFAVSRARSFADAAADAGLTDVTIVPADFSERAGYRAAAACLDSSEPPTAIVSVNDLAGIGALTAVRRRGLGDRVAVTGYDNTYLAALGPIDLTSVEPGNGEIGRRAAQLLTSDAGAGGDVLVTPELVVRASTRGVVATA